MKRYLDDQYINNFKEDFKFLFKIIKNSCGEYDLRLRDNYFNLYYQGNSLAKIIFSPNEYQISIHRKFVTDNDKEQSFYSSDKRFNPPQSQGEYLVYRVDKELLHPFFQEKYLNKIASRITRINNGEEITFEQMLITDNLNRENLIIIDRQVTEPGLKQRIDLLALKQVTNNQYRFIVLEVKLGKNRDIQGKVVGQLDGYLKHINDNFTSWKDSYEKTYQQLKLTGIYENPSYNDIEIVKDVAGYVVIGGYSGLATKYLQDLQKMFPKYPKENIRHFTNTL